LVRVADLLWLTLNLDEDILIGGLVEGFVRVKALEEFREETVDAGLPFGFEIAMGLLMISS